MNPGESLLDQAEHRARGFLADGRFRKARDEFKLLCKADRARFLPGLIQANLGLAREMLGKGQISEAHQVLAYLRTIAPPETLRPLETELAGRGGRPLNRTERALARLQAPDLPESERIEAADWLVLNADSLPSENPAEARIATEAKAVVAALQAVADQQYDRALECVRALSHGSPFRLWRLWVKGLVAFHRGERVRAREAFAALPRDSVPGRASEPYAWLLADPPHPAASAKVSRSAFRHLLDLAGTSSYAGVIAQAEEHWRLAQPHEMYRVLRDGIPGFPSGDGSLLGALSRFALNCLFTLEPDLAIIYSSYLKALSTRRGCKHGAEEEMILRVAGLHLALGAQVPAARTVWEAYLERRTANRGPDPRFDALALAFLGKVLSSRIEADLAYGMRHPPMRDSAGAVQVLERSIQLDPTHRDAYLTLCEVYDDRRETSRKNRLLDQMTRRFPEDTAVLVMAGRGCLARGALVKGIEYLRAARQLDALDPVIPDLLVEAHQQLARQYLRQNRVDRALQTLGAANSLALADPHHLGRATWALQLCQALVELAAGRAEAAAALVAEAKAGCPSEAGFLLSAALLESLWELSFDPILSPPRELDRLRRSSANLADGIFLLRVLRSGDNRATLEPRAQAWVRAYLKAASKRPFTREQARHLIDESRFEWAWADALRKIVNRILQQDPGDPLFRLFRYQLRPFHLQDPMTDRHELDRILAEALKRKDEVAASRVRRALARLNTDFRPRRAPPPPFREVDEESPLPDELPESVLENPITRQILEALRVATPAELDEMRANLPPGVSPDLFLLLERLARSEKDGMPIPVPGRPSRDRAEPRPAPPKPPPPDPNQLNLW